LNRRKERTNELKRTKICSYLAVVCAKSSAIHVTSCTGIDL